MRSGKKIDSFTLETSKNHLIRNFLRKGRLSPAARSHCKTRSVPIVKFLLPILYRLYDYSRGSRYDQSTNERKRVLGKEIGQFGAAG